MENKLEAPGFDVLHDARIIIIIGPLHILGGAERQAILLAQHLVQESRADVEVWGYGEPGRVSELCEEYGIRWRSMPLPVPWSASRRDQLKRLAIFARALRRARPDVILPFMFFQSVACGLVWRSTGARVCIWNQRCEGRDRLRPRWEQTAVRFTPRFVANSEHGAAFLINKLGVKSERLTVIHNGVEVNPGKWDRARWREHLGVGNETFLACMVANLHQFKDHATLLRAWRTVVDRLKPAGHDPVLLLAGRQDETHLILKALAYDLNLGKSVRFLGHVKDVPGLLRAVDLGVHSSVYEGLPNGVLECMAAGLAVVGTDYPGICEALGPQGLKFLAPAGDAGALAERIILNALNPHLRREAGAANRLRIETEFDPRKMHRKMVSLIQYEIRRERIKPRMPVASIVMENREVG